MVQKAKKQTDEMRGQFVRAGERERTHPGVVTLSVTLRPPTQEDPEMQNIRKILIFLWIIVNTYNNKNHRFLINKLNIDF